LIHNPTQIRLPKFLKMTLNRFCTEPMILTNKTDSNFQKFITPRILIGKYESRLVGKVRTLSTTFVLVGWSESISKSLKIDFDLLPCLNCKSARQLVLR
jgi:hypothetical protein